MSVLPNQIFVAALAMGHDSTKIRLGAGDREHPGLMTQQIRSELFESVHRRIFAVDIVADLCRRHHHAHLLCGLSQRIASKINHDRFA